MSKTEFLVEGKPITIGKRIGKGGEGEVYLLNDGSGRALKVYTVKDITAREAKIQAMIDSGLAKRSQLVAFPLAIAKRRDGQFAGFLMNLVSAHKPLHDLYSPGSRKINFPQADYRFLVRAAQNVARAVASVHAAGCVIGDINHSGILISQEATAALIDADSFQVENGNQRFLCKVGVPEYTPPELISKSLEGIVRAPNHDAFGLAVVIFQLLFMGRHPFVGRYSGVGEMPKIEENIANYRFAYALTESFPLTPPPGIALLSDFPDNIINAFETAFLRKFSNQRPSAQHWVHCLDTFEKALRPCSQNKLHYFPKSASECMWCKMDRTLGVFSFLPSAVGYQKPTAGAFNLAVVWAEIDAELNKIPLKFLPILPTVSLGPSDTARALKASKDRESIAGLLIIVISVFMFATINSLWFISIPLLLYGMRATFGTRNVTKGTLDEYSAVKKKWLTAQNDWQRRMGIVDLLALRERLLDAKQEYEDLSRERSARLNDYQAKRREYQLQEFLERHEISKTKIKGIGRARQMTLESFGIETAADVTGERLLAVPGFGPTTSRPLLEWKQKVSSRFVYDMKPNMSDQRNIQSIQNEFDSKQLPLQKLLQNGPANLRGLNERVRSSLNIMDSTLAALHETREQLEADIRYLGGKLPRS